MDSVKNTIINLVKTKLNTNEEIDCDLALAEYGIDSINIIELILSIEEIFELEFETEKLTYETLRTINSISAYVSKRLEEMQD